MIPAATEYAIEAAPRRRRLLGHLYIQVLLAIFAGVLVGHFYPETGEALRPLGDGFIKLVKMIIAPVIFLTVVTGIASVGETRTLGRVAAKTFAYFLFFSTLALIVGLIVANVVQPGAGMNVDIAGLDTGAVADYEAKAHEASLTAFLLDIIPTTFVSALTEGSILQALFVAILFGLALTYSGSAGAQVLAMLEKLSAVVFRLVGMLMRFAPIGAFGAIAFTIGKYGVGSLANLGALIATFYLTSLLFVIALLLVAMVSSKGAAGVTGAGFITLAATLSIVPSVPVAGLALILGIDRFMSECRALTNFIGNAVATVVVARWEDALDSDRLHVALAGSPLELPDEGGEQAGRISPHGAKLTQAVGDF